MSVDYDSYVYNLCHHLEAHPRDILNDNRFHSIHEVRLVVYHTLAQQGLLPKDIAPLVHRDRTTVLHGLRKAEERMCEPAFSEKVKRAREFPLPEPTSA